MRFLSIDSTQRQSQSASPSSSAESVSLYEAVRLVCTASVSILEDGTGT
jgi:hypothetical protein